jgi:hypothetical protein
LLWRWLEIPKSHIDSTAEPCNDRHFQAGRPLFRATEHAGGPWSPDMLQGSATTALMTREVERLAEASGFAVRRLTFDLWRPAGLRAFGLATDMLRDGRKAKTLQVRLLDGDVEIGRCTALLTAQGSESPAEPSASRPAMTHRPRAARRRPALRSAGANISRTSRYG